MHGDVERRGRRLGSSAPFLIVISTALEMTNGGARNDKKERDLSTTLEMTNGSARDDKWGRSR